jgi:hypothetical protein
MPIQEILIHQPSDLAKPGGVDPFSAPCTTKNDDIAAWNALIPDLTKEMEENGRNIMVLYQTRNGRSWNDISKNYVLETGDQGDYMIAAYSVSNKVGLNYKPGTIISVWFDNNYAEHAGTDHFGTVSGDLSKSSPVLSSDVVQLFRCSDKGVNLSAKGSLSMVNFHMKNGQILPQAYITTKNTYTKYGWTGGSFSRPTTSKWVSAKPKGAWQSAQPSGRPRR